MKRVKTMGKKYILYNSLAGNGKCMYDVQALADTYPDAILKKMTEIASYAEFMGSLAEDDEVILCGGDGTLNIFVNDIKDMDVKNTIYYYASGSGNDFAKDIGHNSHDTPDYQINQYIQHLPEVTINGKKWLFMNNVGFGIDGYCCEEGDRQRTKNEKTHKNKPVNYTAIAIKGLLYAFKPRNAVVKVDGVRHEYKNAWLVPTMNGRYYGGGMMATPGQDRLNPEHTVSVMVFRGKGKLGTLMIFPSIFKGEHVKYEKHVDIFKAKEVEVEFDRPTPLQIDGETILGVTSYKVKAWSLDQK